MPVVIVTKRKRKFRYRLRFLQRLAHRIPAHQTPIRAFLVLPISLVLAILINRKRG